MHINWDIIVRYILGKASEEENMQVEKWLKEDGRNQDYYRKARRYFDLYYTGEMQRKVDMESAWGEFVTYTRKASRKLLWRRVAGYAAVAVILLGAGFSYWMTVGKPDKSAVIAEKQPIEPGKMKAVLVFNSGVRVELTDSSVLEQVVEEYGALQDTNLKTEQGVAKYNTVLVPRGGEYCLVLADGTKVKMNADSKLSFPEKFMVENRRVYLEGEALFEVTKDATHPFIVETEKGDVVVLGTEFNLNAYPDNKFVQTTLVTGKVAFRGEGMPDAVEIVPGEQVTYDKETRKTNIVKVNPKISTAWTEGKWIIEGQRLEDIMKQLARWYDVTVFFQNPEAKELMFTGDLEKYNQCEVVLNIISMSTNVIFDVRNKVITVRMQ